MQDQEQRFERMIEPLLGVNTAAQPTSLAPGQWRYSLNAMQGLTNSNKKRPGTVPVTASALGAEILAMVVYKSTVDDTDEGDIYVSSGTTLYKFNGTNALTGQTMTNALASADMYAVGFTDANSNTRLIIADGSNIKEYNAATGVVKDVVAATNDPAPAPPNDLTNVNAKGIKYIWVHKYHIFVSDGSDTYWYFKRYYYDYIPSVQFERLVRNNDYINGCGVTFNNTMLVPMRRGWNLTFGTTIDDIDSSNFLNTTKGVAAPRSIAKITYPNGNQTVAFLYDDGVHEIYDTGAIDAGSRQYATRSLMDGKIDFESVGFTDAELGAAYGYFDATLKVYILCLKRDTTHYQYVMDVRSGEWYVWVGKSHKSVVRFDGTLYFVGETGHLHKYDETLTSDWNESTQTTGSPIDWDNITDVMMFEDTGYASYLDYIIPFAKQYAESSSIDISVRTFYTTAQYNEAVQSQSMVWGLGVWGEGVWYNVDLTDFVGRPPRVKVGKRSFFFQVRFRNNRDELVEMYRYKLIGRVSGG